MACLDLRITKPTPLSLSLGKPNPAVLHVGEVCGVSGGTLVVLAAKDGPLRTKNGGYLLLNPATNPSEP